MVDLSVDTSIYAPVARPSMLDQFGQAVQTGNAMQQNKLLQLGVQTDQLNLALQHTNALRMSLAALPMGFGKKDVYPIVNKLVAQGIATPEDATTMLADLPDDPAKLQEWRTEQVTQAMSMETMLANLHKQVILNTGPTTQFGTVDTMRNTPPVMAGGVNMGLTPAEEANPVTIPSLATGGDQQITTGEFVRRSNPGLAGRVMGPGNALSDIAPSEAGAGVGAPPGAAGGVAAPAPISAASGAPVAPEPIPASPGPAEKAGMDAYANDLTTAGAYSTQVLPLKKALAALEKLGPGGTGRGSETWNDIKSFLHTVGANAGLPADFLPNIDTIQNFDEARKYLNQYVQALGGANRSDTALLTAIAGNPSTEISNAAATDVVKTAIGLTRMAAAKALEFKDIEGQPKPGGGVYGPRDYARWSADWGSKQDPRAFAVDLMSAKDRKKMFAGMSAAEKETFASSYRAAKDAGLTEVPKD